MTAGRVTVQVVVRRRFGFAVTSRLLLAVGFLAARVTGRVPGWVAAALSRFCFRVELS